MAKNFQLALRECSVFERLDHNKSGNELSHKSRHACDTKDVAERIIRHSASAVLHGNR